MKVKENQFNKKCLYLKNKFVNKCVSVDQFYKQMKYLLRKIKYH